MGLKGAVDAEVPPTRLPPADATMITMALRGSFRRSRARAAIGESAADSALLLRVRGRNRDGKFEGYSDFCGRLRGAFVYGRCSPRACHAIGCFPTHPKTGRRLSRKAFQPGKRPSRADASRRRLLQPLHPDPAQHRVQQRCDAGIHGDFGGRIRRTHADNDARHPGARHSTCRRRTPEHEDFT